MRRFRTYGVDKKSEGTQDPTARDYVQSGLFAQWDGIENVGYGVHDSSSLVWKDLTNNGHDFNVSTEFTFTDTNLTITDSKNLVCRRLSGDFDALKNGYTQEAVVYVRDPDPTDYPKSLFGLGESCGANFYCHKTDYTRMVRFLSSGGLGGTGGATVNKNTAWKDMPSDKPCLVTIMWDPASSTTKCYINGVLKVTISGGGLVGDSYPARAGYGLNSLAGYGSVNGGNNPNYDKGPLNGAEYYAFRVYTRPLTEDEIVANYNVDKKRFNLHTASDYVSDGLAAMWDGIENAAYHTHSDSATAWVDLVNGMNITADCTAGDNYVTTSAQKTVVYTKTLWTETHHRNFTQSVLVDMDSVASNTFFNLLYCYASPSAYRYGISLNSARRLTGDHLPLLTSDMSSPYITGIHRFDHTVEENADGGTDEKLYIDGVEIVSARKTTAFSATDTTQARFYFYKGVKYYNYMHYTRPLTAEEISANYEIDKVRFGLE